MSTPHWFYGPFSYVRLYYQTPTGYAWLGWLGNAGETDDYAAPVEGKEEGPPPPEATKVQWAFDVQKGSGGDDLADRPWYLTSQGRILDGTWGDGYTLYWKSGTLGGTTGYPMAYDVSDVNDNLLTLHRVMAHDPAGSIVHTLDNYSRLAYYQDGSEEVPVFFEFVPASDLESPEHENWVRDRKSIIGGRNLTQIVIPGSHDAGAYEISRPAGDFTSRTQLFDITSQLSFGARFLDLRPSFYADDGVWYIKHGSDWTDVRWDHVIEQVGAFLDNHPEEFLIIELLVDQEHGTAGMTGRCRDAWQMLWDRVHQYHWNYTDENGVVSDITTITPDLMTSTHKNLLVFGWGKSTSWYFDVNDHGDFVQYANSPTDPPLQPGGTRVFISPWESKPEGGTLSRSSKVADFEGVYADYVFSVPSAEDILKEYQDYVANTMAQGLWNLQTNVPYQAWNYDVSLWLHHQAIWPGIVDYLQDGSIARPDLNIVNVDFVGDIVNVYPRNKDDNLVSVLIKLNDT
ncbi:MAG: hypothetical protein J7518_06070 [Nocardioidaceae bacterium]|nr:hypothetical protein [Nocardioidaceae bacterium]